MAQEPSNNHNGATEAHYQRDGEADGGAVGLTLTIQETGHALTLFSVPGISAVPHEDNLRYFDVSIHGPSQSPYEGVLLPSCLS